MYLLMGAGILTSLIPLFFQFYTKLAAVNFSFLTFLLAGSFLAMVLLFFLPVFLLGMISPFAIRIAISDVQSSGKTAGSLYAFSTLGSIVGTFLSAFILIPFWGTKETIYLSALILLVFSAWGLKKKPAFFLLMLIPIALYFVTKGDNIKPVAGLIYEKESPYQYIQITESGDRYELRVNDGLGLQSIYDPNNILVDSYYDSYAVLPYFVHPNRAKDVLLIGVGGGTISRQYLALFQNRIPLDIDAVEIDPEIINAAKQYFDLAQQPISIHVSDGRTFLEQTDRRYDILIVDAYSQQIYIPFYLTTREFFSKTKDHLKEKGILAINVNAASRNSNLLNRILQTLKSVYAHTYLSPLGEGYNWLVLASESDLDLESMKQSVDNPILQPVANDVISGFEEIEINSHYPVLTDNRAPIELLTEKEIMDYLFKKS